MRQSGSDSNFTVGLAKKFLDGAQNVVKLCEGLARSSIADTSLRNPRMPSIHQPSVEAAFLFLFCKVLLTNSVLSLLLVALIGKFDHRLAD
jgi:hypothetical protein